MSLNNLRVLADGGRYEHALFVQPSTDNFSETYFPTDAAPTTMVHPIARNLRRGQWERVVMDYDLAGGTLSVTFSGDVVLANEKIMPGPGTVELFAGIFYVVTPVEAWSVYMDDVVLELTP
jgi:hypothetical protein